MLAGVGRVRIYVGDMHDDVGIYLRKGFRELRYKFTTFEQIFTYKYHIILDMFKQVVSLAKVQAQHILQAVQGMPLAQFNGQLNRRDLLIKKLMNIKNMSDF